MELRTASLQFGMYRAGWCRWGCYSQTQGIPVRDSQRLREHPSGKHPPTSSTPPDAPTPGPAESASQVHMNKILK